jgi:diaminopimelate epimerase
MSMIFTKMHGAGNDFVVIDLRAGAAEPSSHQIAALADRRRGIGFDQFIMLAPAEAGADAVMLIRNADGSAAGACGNAARCVAWLLAEESGRDTVTLQTAAGLLPCIRLPDGRVCVDMGAPRLGWADVPLARAMDTLNLDMPGRPAALSMGNPHVTFFVPRIADIDIAQRGPAVENAPLFPGRVNVGFAEVMGPTRLRLRVWERGAGLTLACGSGACAALVNAHRRGFTAREAEVDLDGGTLSIAWREADGHVLMTGPVATVFRGDVELRAD